MSLSDAESLRRFLAGDNDGFRVIAERYKKLVLRYLKREFSLDDRVADVTQETFFRLYRQVMRDPYLYLEDGTLRALILTIAKGAAIDQFREESARSGTENALALFPPLDLYRPDTSASVAEVRIDVQAALAKLPPTLRRVAFLHYLDGYSSTALAEMTALPVTAIKYRILQVRELLINHLKDYRKGRTS